MQWQGLKALTYADTERPRFAYRGDVILILPAPGAGKTLAFEYVNKNWAQSESGTAQTKFEADTDTTLLDEELLTLGVIVEYLGNNGLPTAKAMLAFDDRMKTLMKNDQPAAGILLSADIFGGGRHFSGAPAVGGNLSI